MAIPLAIHSGQLGRIALHSADVTPYLSWEYATGKDGVDGPEATTDQRIGFDPDKPPSEARRPYWLLGQTRTCGVLTGTSEPKPILQLSQSFVEEGDQIGLVMFNPVELC